MSIMLIFESSPAAAATYEQQCKGLGLGYSLRWDGVGLRWCCQKHQCLDMSCKKSKTFIAWCKS